MELVRLFVELSKLLKELIETQRATAREVRELTAAIKQQHDQLVAAFAEVGRRLDALQDTGDSRTLN